MTEYIDIALSILLFSCLNLSGQQNIPYQFEHLQEHSLPFLMCPESFLTGTENQPEGVLNRGGMRLFLCALLKLVWRHKK